MAIHCGGRRTFLELCLCWETPPWASLSHLALFDGKQCLWPTPWAFSSGFLPLAQATGAGVWDRGLPAASRFKPTPQTRDSIAYRESYYSQVAGYIFICAREPHLLFKEKATHLAKAQSGKNVLLDKYSGWLFRMFEMMNCVEKNMPVANCQQAIFGGPTPGSLPTEFTQP